MTSSEKRNAIAEAIITANQNIITALADLDVPIKENRTLYKRFFDGVEAKRKELSEILSLKSENTKLDGKIDINIDDLPTIKEILSMSWITPTSSRSFYFLPYFVECRLYM